MPHLRIPYSACCAKGSGSAGFQVCMGRGGGSICSTYLQTLLIKIIKVVGGQTCLVALLLLLTLLPVDDSGFLMTGHIETKGLTAHSLSK